MIKTQEEAIEKFLAVDGKIPGGRIQWKGTDVCMDFDCECGEFFHVDGFFAYSVECPECHRKYALDWHISAVEIKDRPDSGYIVGF